MLKVYNTLTREKEEFKPLRSGEVGIYVCGVTPYNDPHIGNARPFVTWDVIKRFFQQAGYKVTHVQNFTDVDDKIIRKAKEEGVTWKEISTRYINNYFLAMDALNVQHADIYPRVSENIDTIINMITVLVDKGYAYTLEGDVYYSVEDFSDYGKLSGRRLEDMQAGARIKIDERKHHPMDFALWKSVKPGEPFWESPWGNGRPGWHIECSAMALKFLGKTFDFHGGGSDLIFPHHENEIAQSQACCGDLHSFARYWLHNGFITIHDEKMSKSKNNFFTVQDILKKYPGEIIRFFILQTHYRSPLDFSSERLQEAQAGWTRLKNAQLHAEELQKLSSADNKSADKLRIKAVEYKQEFIDAMEDDFNTALAISYMFALSKEINKYYSEVTSQQISFDAEGFAKVDAIYRYMASIIGIFEGECSETKNQNADKMNELMAILLNVREQARNNKDWKLADIIRDDLQKIGIEIKDTPAGVKWQQK